MSMPASSVFLRGSALALLVLAGLLGGTGCRTRGEGEPEADRQRLRIMRDEAIDRLAVEQPERDLRGRIARSYGYAVAKQVEATVLFASGAGGSGIAVDRAGHETFFSVGGGGLGLGLGATDDRLLLLFRSPAAYDRFITAGWEVSGKADATVATSDRGAVANANGSSQDVEIYRLTEGGVALRATLTGVRYWPDERLNR